MEGWLGIAGNISTNSSLGEMFEKLTKVHGVSADMSNVVEALNIISTNLEKTAEGVVRVLNILDKTTDLELHHIDNIKPLENSSPRIEPGPKKPQDLDRTMYAYPPGNGKIDSWHSDSNQTKPLWRRYIERNPQAKEPAPKVKPGG